MPLRDYEDYILLAAAIMAAVSEALAPHQKYAIYALILGAVAKALMSIVSRQSAGSGGGFPH